MKLYLFDIDGTLISPGLAARRSINWAIENYTGTPPNLQIKDVAGLTDKIIVKNALIKSGVKSASSNVIDDIVNDYLNLFEKSYQKSDDAFPFKDAVKLVHKVKESGIPFGLLTGNMKRGAQIKLGRFDLMHYFPFGAFADDGEKRDDLPAVARTKAMQYYNKSFRFDDIVLIGDTPEDAHAAKTNGCKSIIVCRRLEWHDEIVAAGADLIVERLDDPQIKL